MADCVITCRSLYGMNCDCGVAQSVEQRSVKPRVGGSSPPATASRREVTGLSVGPLHGIAPKIGPLARLDAVEELIAAQIITNANEAIAALMGRRPESGPGLASRPGPHTTAGAEPEPITVDDFRRLRMTIKLTGTVRSKNDTLSPDFSAQLSPAAMQMGAIGYPTKTPDKRECSISVQVEGDPTSNFALSHLTFPVTPGQLAEIAVGSRVTIEVQTLNTSTNWGSGKDIDRLKVGVASRCRPNGYEYKAKSETKQAEAEE